MMFGARPSKWTPCCEHPVERAIERRIGLHREPALASGEAFECRLQEHGAAQRHLLDHDPRQLDLRGVGAFARQCLDPVPPERRLGLPDVADDRRIRGRADRAVRDRVRQFVDRARIVPDVRRGGLDRPSERRVGQGRSRDRRCLGHLRGASSLLPSRYRPRPTAYAAGRPVTDPTTRQRLTGAQVIVESLVRQGVRHVAGIPGHGCWALTDALLDRRTPSARSR